jgi:hypothetical protein
VTRKGKLLAYKCTSHSSNIKALNSMQPRGYFV